MKQTLIKLSDIHYIVVDDSEIKEGCFIECNKKLSKVIQILEEDIYLQKDLGKNIILR